MPGFWHRTAVYWGLAEPAPVVEDVSSEAVVFSASGIDAAIARMAAASSPSGPAAYTAPVTREFALGVPAVLRGRNIICAIATLPLRHYNTLTRQVSRSSLLEQIDPDVPNIVTLAQTVEDLMFDAVAWWEILATGAGDFPVSARHLEPARVSMDPPNARAAQSLPSGVDVRSVVWIDGKPVPKSKVIRFDSPNPPLLVAGRRAIRRAALLDVTAAMYAENPRPMEYWTAAEGEDPEEAEVLAALMQYRAARQEGSTAYIPVPLDRHEAGGTSPADLQLVQLQARASLDIANALGLDPEDLGVSTTSRSYANITDRRRDRINDTLSPYMQAITSRLSMNDVTRRGWAAEFVLDDYLRADPKTRAEVQAIYLDKGVIDPAEVREDEGMAPRGADATARLAKQRDVAETLQKVYLAVDKVITADEARAIANKAGADLPVPGPFPVADPAAAQPDQPAAAAASRRDVIPMHRDLPIAATFGAEPDDEPRPWEAADPGSPRRITFTMPLGADFAVDLEERTITGLAVPFGEVTSDGRQIRFAPGSIESTPHPEPVLMSHGRDSSVPVGIVRSVSETAKGQRAVLAISKTPRGDEALVLADDRAISGLSIGVDLHSYEIDTDTGDITVTRAVRHEISLTPFPAFDSARITKVQMTQQQEGSPAMKCTICGHEHAAGTPCTVTATASTPQAPASAPAEPSTTQVFTAPPVNVTVQMPETFAADVATALGEARAFVDPDRRPTGAAFVSEPLPYRFGGAPAEHDFSTDVFAAARSRDPEAQTRLNKFMEAWSSQAFAVATTDVDELNPTRQRPDLWVDQKDYVTPIWDSVVKGTIPDATPFALPKFNSASGLVADHTQGSEPTYGSYTTTGQTITPAPISGGVEINREVMDQGGNPQISVILWNQIQRNYREALESKIAATLNGLSAGLTTITITTAAADSALVSAVRSAFGALQFVRGGFRFRDLKVQVDLYTALLNAKDTQNRPFFAARGQMNTDGSADSLWAALDVNGLMAVPAWALGATSANSSKSWLYDRNDVHGWATPPQRLDFEYQVKSVVMGVWGYQATAVTDITGVRAVAYDPA